MHLNRKKTPQKKRLKIRPNAIDTRSAADNNIKHIPRVRNARKKRTVIPHNIEIVKSISNSRYKNISDWKGIIKGQPAFVLGNAPSISTRNLKILNDYFTVGVNRIFYIYDPTVLIWQDQEIWIKDKKKIMKQRAIKVCRDRSDPRQKFINFELNMGKFKFKEDPGKLNGRGNTGALAVQLAVAMGCSCVVLLGMDCKYEGRSRTDFYGRNKDHKHYTLKMCKNAMNWIKRKCPVPVYNCSNSDIWERRELEDVVKELDPPELGRDYYLNVLKK